MNGVKVVEKSHVVLARDMKPGQIAKLGENLIVMRVYRSKEDEHLPILVELETGDWYSCDDLQVNIFPVGTKIELEVF